MKVIRIILEHSKDPLFIRDEDKTDLDTYTKKVLEIFDNNRIVTLKTSEGQYIVKPSKILAIDISELAVKEDIITDGD
jgi:hypothetical protein